jgi:hypothetical protein
MEREWATMKKHETFYGPIHSPFIRWTFVGEGPGHFADGR